MTLRPDHGKPLNLKSRTTEAARNRADQATPSGRVQEVRQTFPQEAEEAEGVPQSARGCTRDAGRIEAGQRQRGGH